MAQFSIAQLWIFPVKSLGGMAIENASITASGSLLGDREWLVTRPDGAMLWQGDIPAMTLLQASLDAEGLRIIAPDGEVLTIDRHHPGATTSITQYGHTLPGIDAGDSAADWLSHKLGAACRLVRIGPAAHDWGGLNPVHAVSLNSLVALNQGLVAHGDATVEAERFRANVILSGDHHPFAEEAVAMLDFGTAQLLLREACVRCELPNISRVDASRSRQPLKLIGRMAKGRLTAKPASFGIYATAQGDVLRNGMSCGA